MELKCKKLIAESSSRNKPTGTCPIPMGKVKYDQSKVYNDA